MLTFELSQYGAVRLVEIAGRLDESESARLLAIVGEAIAAGARRIILEMSAVEHIGEAGLFTLMQALKLARRNSAALSLAQPSDAVREALAASALGQLLRIYDSRAEALESP
ncbi:MAG: STAS domain-containing protein [Chloroflexi bacterium]|nr:STAS domain-containing protein [Chloroflexota bacterium]MCY3581908.1 STAS domain-containing protein [Chloroflexota bacterium]MCY3717256.1 STAS domain-containing protein [Chloroflexota bacterium]MDE2651450.1 STAS domain-containing protein [Chloroflexota bacterium]MXV93437.1 STAS domain-containing protein [Chloroflexota bacterium]